MSTIPINTMNDSDPVAYAESTAIYTDLNTLILAVDKGDAGFINIAFERLQIAANILSEDIQDGDPGLNAPELALSNEFLDEIQGLLDEPDRVNYALQHPGEIGETVGTAISQIISFMEDTQ